MRRLKSTLTPQEWQATLRDLKDTRGNPYTFEGVMPYTEGPRGITLTRVMAFLQPEFMGKVARSTFYEWIEKGRLPIVGYVCTQGTRVPVFWSQDLADLIAAMAPNKGKYRPGESGRTVRNPRAQMPPQARQFD